MRIDFTPGALNGATSSEVAYYWQAGGASGTLSPGQTITNGAFPNGSNVGVSVYPVATVNGERSQGDNAGPVNVNAYGPPRAPSVSARGNVNDVTVSWNASGSGNGRSIVEVETNTGGGKPVSGEQIVGDGRNQTHCISARAKDETGLWGDWSGQQCASTWGSPTFYFTVTGRAMSEYPGWYQVDLTLRGWNPNSSVYCYFGGIDAPDWSKTFQVDGNGNWGAGYSGARAVRQSAMNDVNNNASSCQQR